jgi:hypothetical protein
LAVALESFGDEARVEGTIRVTDQCVLLTSESADETLLVWDPSATSWNPEAASFTYTNENGLPQTFSDGNHLILGGITSARPEGGPTNIELAASVHLLSRPAAECLRDVRLFVNEVQIPQ